MQDRRADFQIFLKIYFDKDFNVDEITAATGLQPCLCERYSMSGYTKVSDIKQDGAWWYSFPSPTAFLKATSVQEVLDEFFQPFDKEKTERLRKIVRENGGKVRLTVNIWFFRGFVPELCFDGQPMRILNSLDAGIDINMNEEAGE